MLSRFGTRVVIDTGAMNPMLCPHSECRLAKHGDPSINYEMGTPARQKQTAITVGPPPPKVFQAPATAINSCHLRQSDAP